MFVGHYSAAFFAKSLEKSIPLWVLFLAVQLVDILWAIFVITGVEKLRLVDGFTRSNALDLYFMPYTHSLLGALGWSAMAFALYYFLRGKNSPRLAFASLLLGFAVFSHWILDLLVHKPDLGLSGDSNKVGLGLWNYPEVSLPLELILLFVGLWFYLRSSKATSRAGRYAMLAYTVFLALFQLLSFFGPSPETTTAFAATGLTLYLAFAGIAFWLERYRN